MPKRNTTNPARQHRGHKLRLWLDQNGQPTIPSGAFRRMLEDAAKKTKQGPQVREGLIVTHVGPLQFDKERYGTTIEEWGKTTQFLSAVIVQRQRIIRTRAKFEEWSITFVVEVDDELVDEIQLRTWLDIGGRRLGLGDWRPQKSGDYGRFELVKVVGSLEMPQPSAAEALVS